MFLDGLFNVVAQGIFPQFGTYLRTSPIRFRENFTTHVPSDNEVPITFGSHPDLIQMPLDMDTSQNQICLGGGLHFLTLDR